MFFVTNLLVILDVCSRPLIFLDGVYILRVCVSHFFLFLDVAVCFHITVILKL